MKFYVTFGQDHPLRYGYVVVEAPDMSWARAATFEVFGPKFCTVYPPDHDMSKYHPAGAIGEPIVAEEIIEQP